MSAKYLEISNVAKAFPSDRGQHVVVEGFNLDMARGEFVSLIGHSGCGKSTVLSMVAGLTSITAGGMILAGREITEPGPDRGVVFQSPNLFPWMTALENVMLGVEQVHGRHTPAEQTKLAAHYLELVGLGDSLKKKPGALSQGMRQRVGLARAFALTPNMLLLDEPFGMLDSLTRMELQDVLIELWAKDRKTALMVTHDVDEALFLSDRIVMMTQGPRAHVGEILTVPFARPRTRKAVLADPNYYPLRERIIGFLEEQETRPKDSSPAPGLGTMLMPLAPSEG
jgi:nitrate/nitrite transport system ATP-binding protein